MMTRKKFLVQGSAVAAGTILLPSFAFPSFADEKNLGVQLYTFRNELEKDPLGTMRRIADMGIKKIESAKSGKGHYYGFQPAEMKKVCADLGMQLVSGHVALDKDWEHTMEEAVESGQEYLICSSMPSDGQTVDNYKSVAEAFNKAGEACKKLGIKFGYHNHDYEFDSVDGQVLYEVLLNNTETDLVHMELDLGWVVVVGKDPMDYFERFPGRFPLWHLKDMDLKKQESTEFGRGGLDIPTILKNKKASGVRHIFLEQEEYSSTAFESMEENMAYLSKL
ncbi:MAG: sugar phosphate isomerase/epimerase [Sediminicola sp.]|tara:strand:+ start:95675 stop:96511 length:837 start_codon:yes stop_codon:yes gene_type:complete